MNVPQKPIPTSRNNGDSAETEAASTPRTNEPDTLTVKVPHGNGVAARA